MRRVEEVFLFVEIDADGSEGIVGMGVMGGNLVLPMVTTSRSTASEMRIYAQQHAKSANVTVELRCFGGPSKVLQVFRP